MKDLHLPPPHQPRRSNDKRSTVEHDIEREENTPTDAPDADTRRPTEPKTRMPNFFHPKWH